MPFAYGLDTELDGTHGNCPDAGQVAKRLGREVHATHTERVCCVEEHLENLPPQRIKHIFANAAEFYATQTLKCSFLMALEMAASDDIAMAAADAAMGDPYP